MTPEAVRPFPKAASCPCENGKRKVNACINELQLKNEKKKNAGTGKEKRGPQQKKPVQKPHFIDEGEVDNVWMLMDESSKYSVKIITENLLKLGVSQNLIFIICLGLFFSHFL